MGRVFEELCKGPVVVVDDQIGTGDDIDKLVAEIRDDNKLPVLCYTSIEEARGRVAGLLFCNFIVLDWVFAASPEQVEGEVRVGAEAEAISREEVIDFIRAVQKISLAPIFVLSAFNPDEIRSTLQDAGIKTEGERFVFVEGKSVLSKRKGALTSRIEKWIKESPHIYLSKWWTNEWLSKNTRVFWDLCDSIPDWPAWFYKSFEQDGNEPLLALIDSLSQLVYSEISVSSIDRSLVRKKTDRMDDQILNSLKKLYERLVYTRNDINKDIRPGDVFRLEDSGKTFYLLNVRPECDTVKREQEDEEVVLYCLKGKPKKPRKLKDRYDAKFGLIERKTEILLLLLDGNDIVRFDNKNLELWHYSDIVEKKICRVVSPFINRIRQSYCNFLGRIGVPSYPKEISASIFKRTETS